jgi:hypothetical protein
MHLLAFLQNINAHAHFCKIHKNGSFRLSREKNSGSFFSKYRQLFRIFLGKFLDISRNFRDFSGNLLEKFQSILERFYRCFSRRKKHKNNNILLLSENFVCNFVKFQGAEFLINFLFSLFFFEKFREITDEISGN